MVKLPSIVVKRKTGEELFHDSENSLPVSLKSFWQWSSSDLTSNTLRGILAEFIVASATGCESGVRREWDAYDLVTQSGIKVEVKSGAYIQSWTQKKYSTISFGIQPTYGWNSDTNEYSAEKKRQADVYVFCVLNEIDQPLVDPLNLDQWDFYVLAASELDDKVGEQKTITLSSLLKLCPLEVNYSDVNDAIERVQLSVT